MRSAPDRVHVVLNPSPYSSEHSVADAEDLARRQGIHARTIPIKPMMDGFDTSLDLHGLAAENLQARIRGVIWMALSNAEGHLVLACGNKSELATGYSTLYGDAVGGYAPIKDVPKTLVWELARWRNEQAAERGETPPIPENSITKPPSAELAPGQLDTDSLPDYHVLDKLLDDYVEKDMGSAELVAAGHDPALVERVIQLVDRAEYKRRQYPPGPKISAKNFGRDRRLPITSRWREPRVRLDRIPARRLVRVGEQRHELGVHRQLAIADPHHSRDAARVGHEDARERAQVCHPHRAVPQRHRTNVACQQLHGDTRQHCRGRDDLVTVEKSDVRHRALGNQPVRPGQQRFVETVPLSQLAVVCLTEITEMLDVRDGALIGNGLQTELGPQRGGRPDDH